MDFEARVLLINYRAFVFRDSITKDLLAVCFPFFFYPFFFFSLAMTIDEFEPEHALLEISRKLSNVTIHNVPSYGETVERDTVRVKTEFNYILCSSFFFLVTNRKIFAVFK